MKRQLLIVGLLLGFTVAAQKPDLTKLGLKSLPLQRCTPVKDQYMSSTCWSFSANSFLESEVMRLHGTKTDLSEMFVARHSYKRKIETYLKSKGQIFFTPGGQFHDVIWVLKNYGIMPEQAYNGRPNNDKYHNHARLDTLIKYYVAGLLEKKITLLSPDHHHYIDSVFDYYLGALPKQFEYDGNTYSPQQFLNNYLKIDPDNYVEITSYTHHPFYSSFVLEDKYNWTGDKYWNVPMQDFISITNQALQKGFTVGWDGDVDEPGFDYENCLAYLPKPVNNLQKIRQESFKDQSTDIDHMMHIVAVAKDQKGINWYYVKNSWGDYSNALKGFMYMSRDYFAVKTSAIIVAKAAIPPAIRARLSF